MLDLEIRTYGNKGTGFKRLPKAAGRLRADNRSNPLPTSRPPVASSDLCLAELRPVPEIPGASALSRLLGREARRAVAFGDGRAFQADQAGGASGDWEGVQAALRTPRFRSAGLSANASAVPALCFRAPGRPVSLFSSPLPKERDGAPGGAQEVCETSSAGCAKPGHTPSFRDPSLRREVGVPGRAGPCEEAGRLSALHRGTHCRRPHLVLFSGVAIDDAFD